MRGACATHVPFATQFPHSTPIKLSAPCKTHKNLMSSFEFIAALMSIIVGLGVTNLLAGAGRAFYRRKENPLDEVHLVLTIATLLLLVLQWWVTFRWTPRSTGLSTNSWC